MATRKELAPDPAGSRAAPVADYASRAPEHAQPLIRRALADAGKREGDPSIPFATARTPWCARWCSEVLRSVGFDMPVHWGAIDALAWLGRRGYSTSHRGPFLAGDVIGWHRHDASGAVIGGHIAIVLAVEGDRLTVIAGNSSATADRVAISSVPAARVEYAARPFA